MSTILSYIQYGFKVSKIHNQEFGNKYYSQLPINIQRHIKQYGRAVDVLVGAEDSKVLDIFARLNNWTIGAKLFF